MPPISCASNTAASHAGSSHPIRSLPTAEDMNLADVRILGAEVLALLGRHASVSTSVVLGHMPTISDELKTITGSEMRCAAEAALSGRAELKCAASEIEPPAEAAQVGLAARLVIGELPGVVERSYSASCNAMYSYARKRRSLPRRAKPSGEESAVSGGQ